jgi:two-component system, NarL family, sensor histidine kinase DesK
VAAMSETPTAVTDRRGPFFAAIWLFFLLNPLSEGWSRRDEPAG